MKFTFFCDETSHTRKMTIPTLNANEYFETFICAIVGFNDLNINSIERKYLSFETKYKNIFNIQNELKSKIISTKKFKYGFASLFKQNDILFINDYLDFLIKSDAKIYYCFLDKITLIIQQIFEHYNFPYISPQQWTYSVSKALRVYMPMKVLSSLFNEPQNFIKELKIFFKKQILINKDRPIKHGENRAFQMMIDCISDSIKIDFKPKWNYNPHFVGFKKYLKETKLNLNFLYLDDEGEKHPEAKRSANKIIGATKVKNIKSHNCWGIRVSDILCGLLFKITKNMTEYMNAHSTEITLPSGDIDKFRILDDKWFIFDDVKFNLYKKLKNVLIDLNYAWFKTFADVSVDNLVTLTRFLSYIDSFKSFDKFKKIDAKEHMINFHNFLMDELQKIIDKF